MKRTRTSQHEQILQIPAEYNPKLRLRPFFLFFVFGLHLISGKKHFTFRKRPLFFYFFGLHSIVGIKLHNFHCSSVKAAKAKLYKLSTGYSPSLACQPKYRIRKYNIFSTFETVFCTVIDSKNYLKHIMKSLFRGEGG